MTKVSIIGLGYIGLPTAAILAANGYEVLGMDTNYDVVDIVNGGKIHIIENGLEKIVKDAVESRRLKAFKDVQPADIYIICVPTPFIESLDKKCPNLEFVKSASVLISKVVKDGDLIILESTSPVGTTKIVKDIVETNSQAKDLNFAYCPERVLPGKIIEELVANDRVVGGINEKSTKIAVDFYKTFVRGAIWPTSASTAEMCKLAENSYRDINIAYANELSILCDKYQVDVWELIKLANRHPRVDILQPGVGVGGHCIAVDPWFLVYGNEDNARLIKSGREVNDNKTLWIIKKIEAVVSKYKELNGRNPKLACFGLAFKPDIDDLRESPAMRVASHLYINSGYKVSIVEPNIKVHSELQLEEIESALKADILVFLVNHKEFRLIPKSKLSEKIIINECGIDFINEI